MGTGSRGRESWNLSVGIAVLCRYPSDVSGRDASSARGRAAPVRIADRGVRGASPAAVFAHHRAALRVARVAAALRRGGAHRSRGRRAVPGRADAATAAGLLLVASGRAVLVAVVDRVQLLLALDRANLGVEVLRRERHRPEVGGRSRRERL